MLIQNISLLYQGGGHPNGAEPRPVNRLAKGEAKKEESSEPYRPSAERVRHGGWARRSAAARPEGSLHLLRRGGFHKA